MRRAFLLNNVSRLAVVALVAVAAAGCQKSGAAAGDVSQAPPPIATLPLSDASAPPPPPAPVASALPYHPIGRARAASSRDAYAFADRANAASYGFGDAPPDYAFNYQGSRPWAWQGDNGYETVVEPLPDGGDRYYYYQPGSDEPYFVRDPDYGYGYQGGVLVVVYDRHGHLLGGNYEQARLEDAGRYFWRARELREASQRSQHFAVARDNWDSRRSYIEGEQAGWNAAQSQNADWQAYHDQVAQQDQSAWAQERYRREAEAYRVDQSGNDAPRADREHQAALAAAGVAGVGAVGAAALLANHHGQPPQAGQATRPPFMGGRPPEGPLGAPPAQQARGPQVFPGAQQPHRPQGFQAAMQAHQAELQAKQQQAAAQASAAQATRQAQFAAQKRQEAGLQAQAAQRAQGQAAEAQAARQAQLEARTRQQQQQGAMQARQREAIHAQAAQRSQAEVAQAQFEVRARQQQAIQAQAAQRAQAAQGQAARQIQLQARQQQAGQAAQAAHQAAVRQAMVAKTAPPRRGPPPEKPNDRPNGPTP